MIQSRFNKSASSILVAAIAATSSSYAANPTQSEQLEEVLVWATQVRASSVDLSGEAIAIKQADHLSDLLRTIPGVDVGGAHSLNQRITIRSMDDKDLRITIDGANQNTYMYHHMGNLQIHADILESVDVAVGTNSVIDGGLGGAVRFKTKTAKQLLRQGQQFGGRVQSSYADNAATAFALTGYGQFTENLDGLVYYNQVDKDNFEVGGGKIKDAGGSEISGTNGKVKGLDGDVEDLMLKLGWDIDQNQRLQISYETYVDEGDYSYRPDMGLATDLAIAQNLGLPLTYDTKFSRDTYILSYQLNWGADSNLNASLFRNESTLRRDESGINRAFPSSAALVQGTATNTGFNLLASSSFTDNVDQSLSYGLDVIRYQTQYKPDGVIRSEEDAISSAIFIQDRIDFDNGFSLTPGLRYERYSIDSTLVDDSYDEILGALAAEYALSSHSVVKLSATQIFRGPEIGEVFIGAGLGVSPNPEIDAETGVNYELAVAYEDTVLGADRFVAGMTWFQTDIDDYIYDYATPPPGVGGRSYIDNVGDMQVDGFEIYLGYDIGALRTLLTLSQAQSELSAFSQHGNQQGARLDRQQGDTVSLSVDYELPGLDLALHWDMLIVDDLSNANGLDSASLDSAKDGFQVHNISARWSPQQFKGLALTIGVDNVFDEFYASQSSRTGTSFHPLFKELYLVDYEPGRNVKMTASYDF